MNAAFLLMSFVAGADAPPAAVAAPVVQAAPCCAAPACGGCDVCKPNLLDRIKALCKKKDCGCAAPAQRTVFHGFTTAAPCGGCDPCATERHGWGSGPGLLTKLKAKFAHTGCCDAPCGAPGGCALPPVPGGVPTVPGAPPEKMPAPGKSTTADPKGSALLIPGLSPLAAGKSPF